jgi:hypothetical protein
MAEEAEPVAREFRKGFSEAAHSGSHHDQKEKGKGDEAHSELVGTR